MSIIPNPSVPYVGPLHGVAPGWIITVQGTPVPTSKWFAVNLQCGPSMNPRDDIALHINPRFEGNMSKVIRNSLQAQQWGLEENFGHLPFAPGQPFEILILVEPNNFKIAINGQHYTDFAHRMPLNRIQTLAVDGEVTLQEIRFEGGNAGFPQQMQQLHAGPLMGAHGRSPSPQPPGYQQQGPLYGTPHMSPSGYPPQHVSGYPPQMGQPGSGPIPVPTHNQQQSAGHSGYMKMAGAGVGGAVAGAVLTRLMYPGHTGYGMSGQYNGGYGKHHGGGMMGMIPGMGHHGHKKMKKNKMHKMYKMKHHKPKMHKFKHKKGGWGSSSSSSSSSEEE